jgi:DNA-binding response OmpR family regulator
MATPVFTAATRPHRLLHEVSLKIVLIDDYEPIRQELEDILLEWGFEVMVSEAGLSWQESPDLVICGHNPPNCNGLALLQEMRLSAYAKSIPFILTSAHHRYDHSQKYKFQPDVFLPKPFSVHKLLHHINQLCTPTCP